MTARSSSTFEFEQAAVVTVHRAGERALPQRGAGAGADRVERLITVINGLLSAAHAIDGAAFRAAMKARAPASIKAMTNDLDDYARYCRERRVTGLPAEEGRVLRYIADREAKGSSPATLSRRLATLGALHALFGWPGIHDGSETVRRALRVARRREAERRAAAGAVAPIPVAPIPVAPVPLAALLDACEADPPGLRDAALLSLASESRQRMARLVAITCADVVQGANGAGQLSVLAAKGVRAVDLWLSPATMQRIRDWIAVAGIEDGPLFRRVAVRRVKARAGAEPPLGKLAWNHRRGEGRLGARAERPARIDYSIGDRGLTAAAVRLILERRARRAAELGLIPLQGAALEAAIAALDIRSLR